MGKHKCHNKLVCNCPLASGYTRDRGTSIELKVDDRLSTDPIPAGTAGMAGWKDFLGWDSATTERYWRLGLEYVRCRFGIDATQATFDPILGLTFLTVAPDGTTVQTPAVTPQTNLVISPVTFTGSGTYRVVNSTACAIQPKGNAKPLVRLVEFILTFTGNIFLGGTWGAEASVTGRFEEVIPSGQTLGGGVAFGRYTICGKNGKDYYFDMRSWIPSKRWPSVTNTFYYTERFQINPLDREAFGGPGLGTLTIIYPAAGVQEPDGSLVFPWYVRNDWWFGPLASYPEIVDWDATCPAGNISTVLSNRISKCQ